MRCRRWASLTLRVNYGSDEPCIHPSGAVDSIPLGPGSGFAPLGIVSLVFRSLLILEIRIIPAVTISTSLVGEISCIADIKAIIAEINESSITGATAPSTRSLGWFGSLPKNRTRWSRAIAIPPRIALSLLALLPAVQKRITIYSSIRNITPGLLGSHEEFVNAVCCRGQMDYRYVDRHRRVLPRNFRAVNFVQAERMSTFPAYLVRSSRATLSPVLSSRFAAAMRWWAWLGFPRNEARPPENLLRGNHLGPPTWSHPIISVLGPRHGGLFNYFPLRRSYDQMTFTSDHRSIIRTVNSSEIVGQWLLCQPRSHSLSVVLLPHSILG